MRSPTTFIAIAMMLFPVVASAERSSRRVSAADKAEQRRDRAQSYGAPANGTLRNATRLTFGEGAHVRRPHRAFGTRTTVEYTKRAIRETIEAHPNVHELAIGDLSAEHGGPVSDHHSHQSGRDVDLGLYYKRAPAGYPDVFIDGTEANLDLPAMWTLISKLAATARQDGGVLVIYLDYEVQGVIYRWAKRKRISDAKLERIFQYPHGRDAAAGIVRHYRNHAHHLHVRYQCAKADRGCR